MTTAHARIEEPPTHIGAGTTLLYRRTEGVRPGYVVLMLLPNNPVTPYVVARWYPHFGKKEWLMGQYCTSHSEAMRAYDAR